MDPSVLLLVLSVCGSGLWAAGTLNQSAKTPGHHLARPIWPIHPHCTKSSSSLTDCVEVYRGSTSTQWIELICSDSVTLLSGPNRCSGRLEVRTNQSWSSVCEGDFDQQDAEVVCRELDCGPPSLLQGAPYGEAEAPVRSREFRCKGNESGLLDCGRFDSDTNTCSPDKAVGLTCSEPLRLVGETSRCAGEVELEHGGEWRPVMINGKRTQAVTHMVCQLLDCGSAVAAKDTRHRPARPVWEIYVECLQPNSSLHECLLMDYGQNHLEGLHVICSGLLTQPNISVSTSFDWLFDDWGPVVFWGFFFNISCSVEPQYPGGSFQLLLGASEQNYTLPAVNHSAHFLFPTAAYGHQGNYTCVYHAHAFSHNFTSESQPLYIGVSGLIRDQIIRHVVVLTSFTVFNTCIYFYFKYRARRKEEEDPQPVTDFSSV